MEATKEESEVKKPDESSHITIGTLVAILLTCVVVLQLLLLLATS